MNDKVNVNPLLSSHHGRVDLVLPVGAKSISYDRLFDMIRELEWICGLAIYGEKYNQYTDIKLIDRLLYNPFIAANPELAELPYNENPRRDSFLFRIAEQDMLTEFYQFAFYITNALLYTREGVPFHEPEGIKTDEPANQVSEEDEDMHEIRTQEKRRREWQEAEAKKSV